MQQLEELVNLYIDEANLDDSMFARAYRLGIRCLRDIHRNETGEPKSTKLEVLANKTAFLPEDYVRDIRVGILNNKGEFVAFRKNNQLTNFDADCNDRLSNPTQFTQVQSGAFPFMTRGFGWATPWSGSTIPSLGVGSDPEFGSYKIDQNQGLVLFDFLNPTYQDVIMEYLPALMCEDTGYLVHDAFSEAVINFIKWKINDSNKNVSRGDKEAWRRDYLLSLRKGKSETKSVNLHDIYASYRRSVRSAPKS